MTTPQKKKVMGVTEAMNRARKMDLRQLNEEAPKAIYQMIYIASQHIYAHFLRHKDEKMRLDACKYVMELLKDRTFLDSLKFLNENSGIFTAGGKETAWEGELRRDKK